MSVVIIRKNNTYLVNDLFQWDTNREIEIYGLNLSAIPEIHFANGQMNKAIVKQATSYEDGVVTVTIPNVLLESASPITVFVCTHENGEFISKYSFVINVKSRPKPDDYIATIGEDEEKIYSYNALENLVNNTIVNLKAENNIFRDEMISEVNNICDNAVSEMRLIVENAEIANADTLDGYNAEDFVLTGKAGTTVFNSDGSITTTYNDGSSEQIVFNADGSITTIRNTLEMGVKTETTKFNNDGSITVTVD